MSTIVQITTTCDQREVLEQLAERLVANRLAACVQIGGPVESVYRWDGNVETSQEWVCLIKTTEQCMASVDQVIKQSHPYDEPEVIAFKICGGSPSYLNWVAEQTDESTP